MSKSNRIKLIISIICFSFLILNLNYNEAHAFFGSKKKESRNYPFPTDEKSFEKKTKKISKADFGDKLTEFEIIIPNDWEEDTSLKSFKTFEAFGGTLGKDLTSEIASFKSPLLAGDKAVINIKKAKLYHEISAKYWLERYMNLHNYLPLGQTTAISDKDASATYSYIDKSGLSKKAKTRAIINGNSMILVEFNSPTDIEKPLEFLQNASLNSFKLLNPSSELIEKTKTVYMTGAADIRYPESWDLYKLDTNDLSHMTLQLHNTRESDKTLETTTLNGIIEIATIKRSDKTNLLREIKLLKERLEESMDVTFDEVKISKKLNPNDRFIFSRYESYIAKRNDKNKTNKEVHLSVLGDEDWYIISFLYTPLQSEDSYNWARNVQSFTTITEGVM